MESATVPAINRRVGSVVPDPQKSEDVCCEGLVVRVEPCQAGVGVAVATKRIHYGCDRHSYLARPVTELK